MKGAVDEMEMKIQLFCEHGESGGVFTALEEVLANPGLVQTDEWIDLENRQLLPPYGAMGIHFPATDERWFSQGAEDIEIYVGFLTNSLFATAAGGIPEYMKPFMEFETFMGVKNVVAKIYEQSGRYILLRVADDQLTLMDMDPRGGKREQRVHIDPWRHAAKRALETFARFYQQIVIPAFLASPIREEMYYGIEVISRDLVYLLGDDYCFSPPCL
jgi:hypothetical protein